jgi:hypothetical protein
MGKHGKLTTHWYAQSCPKRHLKLIRREYKLMIDTVWFSPCGRWSWKLCFHYLKKIYKLMIDTLTSFPCRVAAATFGYSHACAFLGLPNRPLRCHSPRPRPDFQVGFCFHVSAWALVWWATTCGNLGYSQSWCQVPDSPLSRVAAHCPFYRNSMQAESRRPITNSSAP